MMIIRLPEFIRSAREAQGISQKELAQKINITPSAITQYEKGQASLSKETLLALAPLLNINPDFINTLNGNPFKQAKPHTVIKLFIPVVDSGAVIHWPAFDTIMDYNKRAIFAFLQAPETLERKSMKIRRWLRKGLTAYALLIKDGDGNVFVCKRKDDVFIDMGGVEAALESATEYRDKTKLFVTHYERMSNALYRQIQEGNIEKSKIDPIFSGIRVNDSRVFLFEMLRRMGAAIPDMTNQEYEILVSRIEDSGPAQSDLILTEILQGVYNRMKGKYLP